MIKLYIKGVITMKTTAKRLLSLALCLLLCLSLMPAALAADLAVPVKVVSNSNFPDAAFRSYITKAFDKDGNGKLSSTEIRNATVISMPYAGVTSLEGIEFFTYLEELYVEGNKLTDVDLSENTELTTLSISSNQLYDLDLSYNTGLTLLWCSDNKLKTLDVSDLNQLTDLDCGGNKLSKLNVTANKKLKSLCVSSNPLKSINISKNTALTNFWCDDCQLSTLNVSNSTKLTSLWCQSNDLSSIDVSSNAKLVALYCGGNALGALDVSDNDALQVLDCSGNDLRKLNVSANTDLVELNCSDNRISSLTLNKTIKNLNCADNRLEDLDLSKIKTLEVLDCTGNRLSKVYVHIDAPLYGVDTDEDVKVLRVGPKLPGTPVVKTKLNEDNEPVLTWKSVANATKYQVWRSTTGKDGSFKRLATITGTSYTDDSAVLGKTYFYKVRGVSKDGEKGDYSKVMTVTCRLGAPAVKGSVNDNCKPKLTWKAINGAAKYQVYRSTTGKDGSFKLLGTTTGTSYVNNGAKAGNTYYYKVRAVSAKGVKSSFSSVLKIKAAPLVPSVTGILDDAGKPVLSWKSVTGAEKYQIYRSTSADGDFKRIATTSGTSFTNEKAKAGTTYYYKVRAVADDGTLGSFSKVIKLKAK